VPAQWFARKKIPPDLLFSRGGELFARRMELKRILFIIEKYGSAFDRNQHFYVITIINIDGLVVKHRRS
jgi:hypothetical protein